MLSQIQGEGKEEQPFEKQRGPITVGLMNLKLMSWNVRGANDVNKRRIIKSVVRKQKVDLMCIQETKIQLMTDGVGRFLEWRTIEAAGAAGGVLVCWDKRSLELLEWEEGQFSISCKFRIVENGTVWVFTGVYGPFNKKDRECLWDELGAVRGLWGDPWCVGGDFNVILAQGKGAGKGG
ncbi:hypothetical protein CK203_074157 [Vitis vinifera]|uniref:Endonuclease/exonuclease/phosphatase domain-containing protein n=1 Tax=Vitis vinifera TaxID=29760 RepID=A0A438DU60_VITVI|nr:hypothetical protein CK203_074157 [Vitis vinifera]